MEQLILDILPDFSEWLDDAIAFNFELMVGGILFAFILWAIGYAIYSVFGWLNSWTREDERGV